MMSSPCAQFSMFEFFVVVVAQTYKSSIHVPVSKHIYQSKHYALLIYSECVLLRQISLSYS